MRRRVGEGDLRRTPGPGNVSPHFEAYRYEAVAPDVAEAKHVPKAELA